MDQHFSRDRNYHHHHHQQQHPQQHRTRYDPPGPQGHHHLPPPPPPPQHAPPARPPPPLSYRTGTIHTPPYNHHPSQQSRQLPFYPQHRSIEEERPIPTNHHPFSSSSNRVLLDDLLPGRNHPDFDRRNPPDCDRRNPESPWNPSLDDRNCPPLDYDREFNHHRPLPPPPPSYPPVESLRYDATEGANCRLRTERLDRNPREGFIWGRGGAGDGKYRRSEVVVPIPRDADADSKSGGYVRVYGDSDVSTRVGRVESSRRWATNERKVPREFHDSPPSSSFELANGEMKREYSELGRYNNNNCSSSSSYRGGNSRERGSETFTRTPPKKQIQKKSALLRIQTVKPNNHRNRDVEQLRYAGYAPPDSNYNFFRGKEQHHGYSGGDHGMKVEEREGSPVELDISFESNSLVAKAIISAASGAPLPNLNVNTTPVFDEDLASVGKDKKVSGFEGDCSGLQPGKVTTGAVDLNSSPCKQNDTSSAGKELNLQKNVPDTSSQPCTDVIGNPDGKNGVVVSVGRANICTGKSSSRVVKKKKIVKRVVKKAVVNPNSTVSSSLPANAPNGTLQSVSVTLGSSTASGPDKSQTFLEGKSTHVEKVSVPDRLYPLPNEENALNEDKKGDLSSLLSLGTDSRSQECKTDRDSDIGIVSRFERGGGISNSPSCASISEDKKSDFDCLDANNSVHDLHGMPNIDKVTNSLSENTSEINYMDYDNKQLCQSEVSLSHGKYSNVGCPQNRNLVDVGDERNCKFFSSAESVISTDLIDAHKSANNRVYGFNSNDLTVSEEKFTITESGNIGAVGNAYCENMAPTITKNASLAENSDTAIPLESSRMVAFSNSGNTRIQDSIDCLQHASALKQGSDNGSSNLEDSITVHNFGIMKDDQKQMSPSDVIISPKNCDTEITFPCSNTSVGSDEGDTHKIKKGKVATHKFLNSKMEDMFPDRVNPLSNAYDVDRSSSMLLKDPCLSEVLDQSVHRLDLNLQSSLDGVIILREKRGVSETEFYGGNNNDKDDTNKALPVSKRKKVAASPPKLTECQSEFSDAVVATTSNARIPIGFSDNRKHQKGVALSSMGILSTAQTMSYLEDIANLSDSLLARGPFESMDASRETLSSEPLGLQHSDIVSSSADLAFPNAEFPVLECEQKEIINPIVPIGNNQTVNSVIGKVKGEKIDLQAVKESYGFRDFVQGSPTADMESNDLNMNDDLLVEKNLMSCPADDGGGVTTSYSNDDLIEDLPDAISDICSKGMTSEVLDRKTLEFTAIHKENSYGEENPNCKSVVEHDSDLHTSTQHTNQNLKSDHAIGRDPIMKNIVPEPSQVYSKVRTQGLNTYCSELNGSKSQAGVISKTFQGHSFTISKSRTKTSASSAPISKPRTWHRTGNNPTTSLPRIKPSAATAPPKRPILERKGNFLNTSTSYIRKGNSLVRQPTPVSANQSPARSESRADVTDQPIYLKTGETYAPQQRQRIPSLPIHNKSKEIITSPLVDPPSSGFCENLSDPGKSIEANDAQKSSEDSLKHFETSENQTGSSKNGESQVEANDGNISSMNTRRIVYIKPKTNQLVATSNSCDIAPTDEKGQTAFSDGYFKRSKNQLVRTTFENHINQTIAMSNSKVNSDGRGVSKVLCNRRFIKRRSHKVARSSGKLSKASLVWTLCGKNSSRNDRDSLHYPKVLPNLFPWKRTTYLRSFIHNSASSFDSSSLSAISKKLQLSRKRDTVYTRSTHGFSLWKSKVLGVGGYSLKWSKSIEKHSKKANEEATLAVAAVERKKREQKDDAGINSQAKRERIFRIGSVRYRMDPSRRTLQRISDDESLSSASISSGLAGKRAYIPRRLVIGNDEYVRIGSGNQLIRDPKKRTRKLANEKVRWSLHTARQRLARKQKYCQFFTRFGKCNKDGGKCPYIHDPSKVAVCTKFLNGLCSTPNCKLTHKVIPERMPDCSYFLQGLCSNRDCPYRHVNVNPKASICEGFLKGYCADGNECRKKHSYVCPTFEATGTCVQGAKCKLHHPKKESKGKKRKRSGDQNSRARYFGSIPVDVSEPGMMVSSSQQNLDLEKELSDYISLDVNEEVADAVDQSTFCDNDSMDLQLDTYDELKPVLVITKLTSQA